MENATHRHLFVGHLRCIRQSKGWWYITLDPSTCQSRIRPLYVVPCYWRSHPRTTIPAEDWSQQESEQFWHSVKSMGFTNSSKRNQQSESSHTGSTSTKMPVLDYGSAGCAWTQKPGPWWYQCVSPHPNRTLSVWALWKRGILSQLTHHLATWSSTSNSGLLLVSSY